MIPLPGPYHTELVLENPNHRQTSRRWPMVMTMTCRARSRLRLQFYQAQQYAIGSIVPKFVQLLLDGAGYDNGVRHRDLRAR
jgi:hypothetical protein